MERSVTVRTPEAIAFHYELAGLGSRFLAVFVDTIIQVILVFAVLFTSGMAASRMPSLHLGGKNSASIVLAIVTLVIFFIYYGYFVLFERYWNGQTPGKRLLGIRVVRDGGYPVELMDSIIRNLIRVLEFALGFYFLSAISMLLSSENKRLGDYAAGTIVVRDKAMEVKDPMAWLKPESARAPADSIAGKLDARELAVVDQYVARKTSLAPQAARQTAAKIAAMIRPKVSPEIARLPDDELIMRVASRQS